MLYASCVASVAQSVIFTQQLFEYGFEFEERALISGVSVWRFRVDRCFVNFRRVQTT